MSLALPVFLHLSLVVPVPLSQPPSQAQLLEAVERSAQELADLRAGSAQLLSLMERSLALEPFVIHCSWKKAEPPSEELEQV